jgi:hypothetical protein
MTRNNHSPYSSWFSTKKDKANSFCQNDFGQENLEIVPEIQLAVQLAFKVFNPCIPKPHGKVHLHVRFKAAVASDPKQLVTDLLLQFQGQGCQCHQLPALFLSFPSFPFSSSFPLALHVLSDAHHPPIGHHPPAVPVV